MLNISNERIDVNDLDRYPINTLRTLPNPDSGRRLGRWWLFFLLVGLVVMFLPWRQNIDGMGTLTALTPKDRPQTIQNVIPGRIERWLVKDGDYVRQGDTLLVISDIKDEFFDPAIIQRLNEQLTAKIGSEQAYLAKINALNGQMLALETGVRINLDAARNRVKQSQYRLTADEADLLAIRRNYQITLDRIARYEKAYQSGLISLTDLETRRLRVQEDNAKVIAQENKLSITRQELVNAQLNLTTIQAQFEENMAKARSDRSSAVSSRTQTAGEVAKLRNQISNVQIRQGMYIVRAPQNGFIVQPAKTGIGETISAGEPIATLQPDKPQLAVELYVQAMDVPLIQRGRTVRLQFDGWPAIQFSGWPSVAVGTFGGKVAVIDAVSSPDGRYRLLVQPIQQPGDQPWPPQLRVGSGVRGWVMLDDVPIWYELWRLLNGFPPSLKAEPAKATPS
ncbi:HlyD family secretion protein [Spirosoma radiotolerans]|uniref:Biotin attachment protein n=1 Tax=Spirosoma radiotolerans TaxID=1379870 RepID=A0A0E3V7P7_9BACT|nr:HlyD family efflux transporter periplasmic adaptor subunit [Spirosoma radiotolerans]AKD56057.1 biotin attachment protein [Spirosoma radiotolerans]